MEKVKTIDREWYLALIQESAALARIRAIVADESNGEIIKTKVANVLKDIADARR